MNKHDTIAAQIVQRGFATGKVLEVRRNGHQPIASAAQQAVAAAAVKEVAEDPAAADAARQLQEDASARMVKHRDAILRMLLIERHEQRGEIPSADPHELDALGILKGFTYENGTMQYELNGKELVTFGVPAVAFDFEGDGAMNVMQQYRVAL